MRFFRKKQIERKIERQIERLLEQATPISMEKHLEQATPVSLDTYITMFNELMIPVGEVFALNHWVLSRDTESERTEMSDSAWNAIWDREASNLDLITARYAGLRSVRPPKEVDRLHFGVRDLISTAIPAFQAIGRVLRLANQDEVMAQHQAVSEAVNEFRTSAFYFWVFLERLAIDNPEIHRRLVIPDSLIAGITPGDTPEETSALRAQLRAEVEDFLRKQR